MHQALRLDATPCFQIVFDADYFWNWKSPWHEKSIRSVNSPQNILFGTRVIWRPSKNLHYFTVETHLMRVLPLTSLVPSLNWVCNEFGILSFKVDLRKVLYFGPEKCLKEPRITWQLLREGITNDSGHANSSLFLFHTIAELLRHPYS